ncbi:MAG: 4-(cytidine 5'-diphospho)-2-C-methyl-D-erythritol kinase [Solirubrobacteraceae bacterium]
MSAPASALRALAPAKVNLGLFLGPARPQDGRHELATVMQSISLADQLTLAPAPAGVDADEVLCPGVPGPIEQNLAARALAEFRGESGWAAPPVRLEIVKRIPLAAGLAGGSADAAATLRLAHAASGLGDQQLLLRIAARLGADVPAQVAPGRWLAGGAGERLEPLPSPSPPFGLMILPAPFELSTAQVYAEADRLGLGRSASELAVRHAEMAAALGRGAPLPAAVELLHNDLQRAAVSLRPEIAAALRQAREAGATQALLSGSGPTVIGLFLRAGVDGLSLARLGAAGIGQRSPAPLCAVPVESAFGAPLAVEADGAARS